MNQYQKNIESIQKTCPNVTKKRQDLRNKSSNESFSFKKKSSNESFERYIVKMNQKS